MRKALHLSKLQFYEARIKVERVGKLGFRSLLQLKFFGAMVTAFPAFRLKHNKTKPEKYKQVFSKYRLKALI